MMDRLPVTCSKGVLRKPFAQRRENAYADEGVQGLAIYLYVGCKHGHWRGWEQAEIRY